MTTLNAPTSTPEVPGRRTPRPGGARIRLGGVPVDLYDDAGARAVIADRSRGNDGRPLGVVSVNLDHLHHFGHGAALNGNFGLRDGARAEIEWLHLVDGAPVAEEARRRTGAPWPRLAGSDLIGPILRTAAADGVPVGFLGGSPEVHEQLREAASTDHPRLRIAGMWAPPRDDLLDPDSADALAADIAAAGVGILVVCLGKPRQELWIDRYGTASGAAVLLAFGAVVDFLAGRVHRCPPWVARHGLEWAWRLAREPRRLARRYLVQGPGAWRSLKRPDA